MQAKQIKQVKYKKHENAAKEPNCFKQTKKLKHMANGLITWLHRTCDRYIMYMRSLRNMEHFMPTYQ